MHFATSPVRIIILIFLFVLNILIPRVLGATEDFKPNLLPRIEAPRIASPIKIDGNLDDPGWKEAAMAANFCEFNPGDQTKPPVDTKVLLAYDATHLYLAFIAYDDPKQVRSSFRDRDDIWQDDYVGILLDSYGDAAWGYEIFSNPIGIQGDLRQSGNNEDGSFDIVYESRGKVTDSGYQVEISIPFSSLRFPNRSEQTWRATFWRNMVRDTRHQISWVAMDRDNPCFLCQYGFITGIKDIHSASSVEILPAVTGSQSSGLSNIENPLSEFHKDGAKGELSLNSRALLASNSTLDFAWNPDFSQIESDPGQIDVNTTYALFYNERRPFFQEGGDLFLTPIDAVYTRSINSPKVAAKLNAQMNRTTVGYIGARDEISPVIIPLEERSLFLEAGKSVSNIMRVRQTFMEDSYLGALTTVRLMDGGGSGSVFGADGSVRFSKNYKMVFQGLASRSVEPHNATLTADISQKNFDGHTVAFDGESFWGHSIYSALERSARLWSFNAEYSEATPTFRADNGYEERNDFRHASFWTNLDFRPNGAVIVNFSPMLEVGRIWNFRKERKDEWIYPEIQLLLKGQTSLSVGYLWSRETFRDTYFPGIRRVNIDLSGNPVNLVNFSSEFVMGRSIARRSAVPVLGKSTDISVSVELKPTTRLALSPSVSYSRMVHPDSGYNIYEGSIVRTRMSYQFSREIFLRLVVQYDYFEKGLSIEPLLSYKLNPFTIFYIGSTHGYHDYNVPDYRLTETSRQFFMKFQYLFRV